MNTKELIPIEQEGQRVLLTGQLAESYETTPEVISNNFSRNNKRYDEGKHYFVLEGDALREFKATHQFDDQLKFAPKLYLWTERGAMLHAKSLNTDRAWAVYDELVETYFRAKQAAADFSQLSPQLQALINLETEQRRQAAQLNVMEQKFDDVRELMALSPNGWRKDGQRLVAKMARALGGNEHIRDINNEIYALVNERAHADLARRLTNKRQRMADEGICKSKRDKLNNLDVIADDPKLIEIYTKIVRELAIKYGAS